MAGFGTVESWTDQKAISTARLNVIGGQLQWLHDMLHVKTGSTLTVSAGAITVTGDEGYFLVSGEGGADDDLATINGGVDGDIAILAYDDDEISFVDTGNIDIGEGGIPTMDSAGELVALRYNSTRSKWETLFWNCESHVGEIYLPISMMVDEDGSEPGPEEIIDLGTMCYAAVPFDKDAIEVKDVSIWMPENYDGGNVEVAFLWTATTTGSGSVVWGAVAQGYADGDDLGDSGSGFTVTDAFQTVEEAHYTSFVTVTAGGNAAGGNALTFRIYRSGSHASDTFGQDAYLVGVKVRYTKNAG